MSNREIFEDNSIVIHFACRGRAIQLKVILNADTPKDGLLMDWLYASNNIEKKIKETNWEEE